MIDIKSARQREGKKAEDRDERIDTILNRPRLGHGKSDPLIGDSYDEYPEQPTDLTSPASREFVTELFAHDNVESIEDAIAETDPTNNSHVAKKWREAFEKASELFDVDIPEGADHTEETTDSRLAELVGDWPRDMWSASNPLFISYLFADLGLGCGEIADLLEPHTDGFVHVATIEDVLRNCGLLDGTTLEEEKDNYDGKLGGTTVNFNPQAVAESDGVTYEK